MNGIQNVSAHSFFSAPMSREGQADAGSVRNTSSHIDDMKNIAKARLRRQVMADPSLARELVSVEASAVYNSRGSLISALSTRQLTV